MEYKLIYDLSYIHKSMRIYLCNHNNDCMIIIGNKTYERTVDDIIELLKRLNNNIYIKIERIIKIRKIKKRYEI